MSEPLSTDPYKGVRDFYPKDWGKMQAMFAKTRSTLLAWGYEEYNASPLERAELYERINRRSAAMIQAGLLDEVRGLVARGYSLDLKPLGSVGYAQMGKVIRGALTIDAALAEMQQQTRHLAKRQLTWFRGDKEVRWFHPKQISEILKISKEFLSS